MEITDANAEKHIRELVDSSYQGVKRLFVLAYDNTESDNQAFDDSFKKFSSKSKKWKLQHRNWWKKFL